MNILCFNGYFPVVLGQFETLVLNFVQNAAANHGGLCDNAQAYSLFATH
jgi:hypothetical protein